MLFAAGLSIFSTLSHADDHPLSALFIAKGASVYLADSASHSLQTGGLTYLPAGTRFIAYDKVVNYQGNDRRLILTEDGLWSYIPDGDSFYWNTERTEYFKQKTKIAIIRSPRRAIVPLSTGVRVIIDLTPGETYQILKSDGATTTISIGKEKVPQFAQPQPAEVPTEVVSLYDPDGDRPTPTTIRPFEESWLNDVRFVSKECGTKVVRTIKANGGAGIDVKLYFVKLNLDAAAEYEKITDLPDTLNIKRLYYARKGIGTYILTKEQSCDHDQIQSFDLYNQSNDNEININNDIEKKNKINADEATGQPLISCPDDYFRLEKFLIERDFDKGEAAFIISRTARFRDFALTCSVTS